MARLITDHIARQLQDSITRRSDLLREIESSVNISGEMTRAMKKAMGLDLNLKIMGPSLADTMGSVGGTEILGDIERTVKASGEMARSMTRAMSLDLGEAASAVGRTEMLAAAQALARPREDLMRAQRDLMDTARRSFLPEVEVMRRRAVESLVLPLDKMALGDPMGIRGLSEALERFDSGGIYGTSSWAQVSFDALINDLYASPARAFYSPNQTPSGWFEEQLDLLFLSSPDYTRSKLAWILDIFVPRLRLALYWQEQEGDFDGAMEEFWEAILQDPEVRARLRERLEKSGVREEVRKYLSSHLEKVEEGELMYAIFGLYAHIEAFLAELAVRYGLIPHPEMVLCPKSGKLISRRGVGDLIKALHKAGRISPSQYRFLDYVLTNQYDSNRVRHGMSLQFTQSRATALVLALLLALCLEWSMGPAELLQPEPEGN